MGVEERFFIVRIRRGVFVVPPRQFASSNVRRAFVMLVGRRISFVTSERALCGAVMGYVLGEEVFVGRGRCVLRSPRGMVPFSQDEVGGPSFFWVGGDFGRDVAKGFVHLARLVGEER